MSKMRRHATQTCVLVQEAKVPTEFTPFELIFDRPPKISPTEVQLHIPNGDKYSINTENLVLVNI